MTRSIAWLRLACLGTVLLANQAVALGMTTPGTSAALGKAWRDYLANESHHAPAGKFPHESCFRRSAVAYDLPLTLLLAVARGESNFDNRAISSANALGVMQILWPGTAQHLGITQRSELFKPCINIDAGARYLREMITRYQGNLHRALAAYNYGPGRISVQGSAMPQGAQWYSGYIFRHLKSMLADAVKPGTERQFGADQKLPLITFRTPYRAKAFINKLRERMGQTPEPARLDWIRVGTRAFRVILLYNSSTELERGRRKLSSAGFNGS